MTEHKKLGEERIIIISKYVKHYFERTNEKADDLSQRLLKNNAANDALRLIYYKMVKKEISAIRAAQFMQLKLYLQTWIIGEPQSSLPMVGE
jgi:molybdopterin biosynthesis enzyme MoaB